MSVRREHSLVVHFSGTKEIRKKEKAYTRYNTDKVYVREQAGRQEKRERRKTEERGKRQLENRDYNEKKRWESRVRKGKRKIY